MHPEWRCQIGNNKDKYTHKNKQLIFFFFLWKNRKGTLYWGVQFCVVVVVVVVFFFFPVSSSCSLQGLHYIGLTCPRLLDTYDLVLLDISITPRRLAILFFPCCVSAKPIEMTCTPFLLFPPSYVFD